MVPGQWAELSIAFGEAKSNPEVITVKQEEKIENLEALLVMNSNV